MFFFDVSTSGFLSLEKKIERGLRKKYDRHLGRQKKKSKFEAQRTTTTTTKEGEGAYYWTDNVYSYSRHKNEYVFGLQKSFLNCFIKKKTFGKA